MNGSAAGAAELLRRGIAHMAKRKAPGKYLAYFSEGTATYGPLKSLAELWDAALNLPEIAGLIVSTRPDCVPDDVLRELAGRAGRKPVFLELGLQSADDATLRLINRGHTVARFDDAVQRAARWELPVCAHLIIGLPGETEQNLLATVRHLNGLPLHGVKPHNLYVSSGTKLAELYQAGRYRPLELEEYARLLGMMIEHLRPDLVVHRLTATVPRRSVLAPAWAAELHRPLNYLQRYFREHQVRQGSSVPA